MDILSDKSSNCKLSLHAQQITALDLCKFVLHDEFGNETVFMNTISFGAESE
jgi:hypothetical protein